MVEETIQKTNIPTLRMPFGADLPPKVPFCALKDVGSKYQPVYVLDKEIKASDADVGGQSTTGGNTFKPMYMLKGVLTDAAVTIGSTKKFIYMDAGTIKEASTTIGKKRSPVYINNGVFTECNPLSSNMLLQPLWMDYIPASLPAEWIRSDDSYKNAATKPTDDTTPDHTIIYDHLLADYNNAASTNFSDTYTVGSTTITITGKKAPDGHKICLYTAALNTNLNSILNDANCGCAWYYVLDNGKSASGAKKFRLPRSRYGFHGNLSYVKLGQSLDHEMYLFFNTGIGSSN